VNDGTDRRLPVRAADAAQYVREPIPADDRGKIKVRLIQATPDPLGTVAAYIEMYKGNVIRDLSQVTDDMRREALQEMTKTVLNGPLEAVQFTFLVEGQTRSITHQQVRSRASFFAQESLRFAVPEGDWSEEIPLPPWLAGTKGGYPMGAEPSTEEYARNLWDEHMRNSARTYAGLIECGMPAEEARDTLPHAMPTRLLWNVDLRTLLAEAGKRTCTQAQFPWRMIFAGVANELRRYGSGAAGTQAHGAFRDDHWQFRLIADKIRPVCYQTGSCGFMAKFDRSCSIRSRVDGFAALGVPSSRWSKDHEGERASVSPLHYIDGVGRDEAGKPVWVSGINDAEWALNPGAARS
jgi:flavin-dependent thymidylate synthase